MAFEIVVRTSAGWIIETDTFYPYVIVQPIKVVGGPKSLVVYFSASMS